MKILFLTFYFEPDLCAGSFRNTPLFRALLAKLDPMDYIHVVTTYPNRYHSYNVDVETKELGHNYRIDRIKLPEHNSGFVDQINSFAVYYRSAKNITKDENYDIVYASSSRLFTAFLGKRIAVAKHARLFLDIRDIFVDTINDLFKNKFLIRLTLVNLMKCIEKITFANADHINLVSSGFKKYFSKYKKPLYSFLPNGIDEEFLNNKIRLYPSEKNKSVKLITYAGNIGSGQGLEKIIPQAAKLLGNSYQFLVIGDGGTKGLLIDKIKELSVENVKVHNPVSRKELLGYYEHSDYLFLHLNNYEAFKKVLPSKIFEYGALPLPILAGVGGYAAEFIRENLDNCILFAPTDFVSCVNQLQSYSYKRGIRESFIKKYSRANISNQLADLILSMKF